MSRHTLSTYEPEPRRIQPADAYAASRAGQALLIDVRDAPLFENAHLDPSVSVPLAEIEAGRLPSSLSEPPDTLLILYCA